MSFLHTTEVDSTVCKLDTSQYIWRSPVSLNLKAYGGKQDPLQRWAVSLLTSGRVNPVDNSSQGRRTRKQPRNVSAIRARHGQGVEDLQALPRGNRSKAGLASSQVLFFGLSTAINFACAV